MIWLRMEEMLLKRPTRTQKGIRTSQSSIDLLTAPMESRMRSLGVSEE
jgi:hypothetical protein